MVGEECERDPSSGPFAAFPAQLKQDDLWAKWMDVAFSKLDSNGDGYISLDEIVSTVPGSDDAADVDNHLIAVSQARTRAQPQQ